MKILLIVLLLSFTVLVPHEYFAQTPSDVPVNITRRTPAQQAAVEELNATARAYREGNFTEAQRHAEQAMALDPSNKTAIQFLARTIHAQYKPGVYDEINIAKGYEAIDAYKRVLSELPQHEEAYKAIAYFYGALKDDELLRDWVHRRAIDATVSDEKRAEAFIVLASRDWDCSFKITELPTNKMTSLKGRSVIVHYSKPTVVAEFERARQCSKRGIEMIDMAIILLPNSEMAWTYKVNLLLESAKLAEMDNNIQLKSDYERQLKPARSTTETLRAITSGGDSSKP